MECQYTQSKRSPVSSAENRSPCTALSRSPTPWRPALRRVFSTARALMSVATTRAAPRSAAMTAMIPVPEPTSRKEPPARSRGASAPVRPRTSMAASVVLEKGGAKTSSSRSHARPAMVKVSGRSGRLEAARLRSRDRS
ncbi:hypothetical protein VT52_033485 [Streptomyces malaysiense]|uniref:Uncharacterized protein n=1 Tax=Streptomyces malaysiense TaxID=1428626 RepID=A0A1J4PTW8_9ACTN|nr:hypothetical protein VT52_033485 [Streptomyces malaysiense]